MPGTFIRTKLRRPCVQHSAEIMSSFEPSCGSLHADIGPIAGCLGWPHLPTHYDEPCRDVWTSINDGRFKRLFGSIYHDL